MPHRLIVAWGFRVGALAIGLSALLGLLDVFTLWYALSHTALMHPGDPLNNGVPQILSDIWQLSAPLVFIMAGLSVVLIILVAIACLIAIGFAVFLFLTGVAIARQQDWARIAGMVLCGFIILGSASNIPDAHGAALIAPAACIAASLYAIWALGWRYGTPVA